jgi:hypothetical protein
MADVLHMLPRVVHPVDVQTHEICVNGRDWHYLYGVIAYETVIPENGKARPSQDKTRENKTQQENTRQDNARQNKTRQNKTGQDN